MALPKDFFEMAYKYALTPVRELPDDNKGDAL